MTENPIIDLDHLEKYIVGDIALRDEILTIFAEQTELLLARFDVTASDEEWKNTAHAFKGASRGIGAWALGDLCQDAEGLIGEIAEKQARRCQTLEQIEQSANLVLDDALRLRDAA